MKPVSQHQFPVGGGTAVTALSLAAIARSLTEASGPDSTFSTPSSGSGLLPLANPTFVGNGNPLAGNGDGGGPSVANHAVADNLTSLATNASGTYISCGVQYNETVVEPQLFATASGQQHGCQATGTGQGNTTYQMSTSVAGEGMAQVAVNSTKM